MPELSLQNIEQISHDISRQEISFSHLLDELIDHVCCDVENEMLSGLSFSEAYQRVKLKIGHDCFRQIQKDTLYAVDFKYRNMRNTMKISGIAGTVLFGLAALFKIQHWPLAGVMMTLGAFILALIFLPSALGVLWKETHNKNRILLFVSGFIAGAFFITGTLFKVQHWPGADVVIMISVLAALLLFFPAVISMILKDEEIKKIRGVAFTAATGAIIYLLGMLFKIQHWALANILIFIGSIVLGIIALPWYTRITFKEEKNINGRFIFLVVAFLAIIIPGALINNSLQYAYEEGYIANQERQDSFYSYFYERNALLVSQMRDTTASRKALIIHGETIRLLEKIDEIQKKMVRESEGEPGKPALSDDKLINTPSGLKIRYKELSNPMHMIKMVETLPGDERTDITGLHASIEQYSGMISLLAPESRFTDFRRLLNPVVIMKSAHESNMHVSLMSVLHSLSLLKSNILTAESVALISLQQY